MSKLKQSGHSRLKTALVLRDALASELGIDLLQAMRQLARAEETLGARQGLDEGHFLAALHSVCIGDLNQVTQLDTTVRTACAQVRLAPRYAQYLGLLLFVCWLEAQRTDAEAFLCRLNQWLETHTPRGEVLEPFVEADLQCAAFWMATAAGKTHVLHACLALLFKHHLWDRILLVTPSEALTRQHADKLRDVGHWEVFAYPQDGDQTTLGRLSPDTVIVLDINKLSDAKKGEGVTVPMTVFEDGRNLVFVDEGHKGQKSEESVWKRLQQDLAGIDAMQPRHRGMLIEFSATFGQVAEKEHAFGRYAKSVIFDYAYDRFHADLYGKDFWHVKLDGRGEADQAVRQQTMTAALLSFWHQVDCYRSGSTQQQATELGLQVAAPLWVLLGLSVIGGSNKSDKEQTSDVIDVLRFLAEVVRHREQLTAWLGDVLEGTVVGCDLLPREVRAAIAGKSPAELAHRILTDIFAWQPGDKPVLRLLKIATGELGIGLRRGDHVHYFGVVNVGDAGGLKKALEGANLQVEDDALAPSLFDDLGRNDSGVNILIGSRRFAEGWTKIQTFGFVDPKGLAIGAAGGWSDFKIVSTIYMPHVVNLQLGEEGEALEYEGEEWTFRIRGVLVSTSSLESLTAHAKFKLRDEMGNGVAPTEDDFRRARIVFQKDDVSYIDSVLDLLLHDTGMDKIVAAAASLQHAPDTFTLGDEVSYDLALRLDESEQSETEFVGALLADYLKPDSTGQLGACVQRNRRSHLLDYAKEGILGLGAEKAVLIRDNPTPCAELWNRKQK